MWLLIRSLLQQKRDMDLILERSIIKVVAENHCSVVFMERITIRRIGHCTRVADLKVYSSQEAQIVRDVGQIITHIYATFDNKQADNQASSIRMEGKLCDRVSSILIDPGSNYIYININLVDKCAMRKEGHVESWVVQLATSTKKCSSLGESLCIWVE